MGSAAVTVQAAPATAKATKTDNRRGFILEKPASTRLPGHGLQPKTVLDHKGTLHFVYLAGNAGGSDVFYTRRNAGES